MIALGATHLGAELGRPTTQSVTVSCESLLLAKDEDLVYLRRELLWSHSLK